MENEVKHSSDELIQFIERFTFLLRRQLESARDTLHHTVEDVMTGVSEISKETQEKKGRVEEALESTYLNPDAETKILVDDLQESVSDFFDEVSKKYDQGEELGDIESAKPEVILHNRLQRFSSRFSKEMNQLGELDDRLRDLLFGMMGALSSDDVISQRMNHAAMCLSAMQVSLNYLLVDFKSRCNSEDVGRIIRDLKTYSFNSYTMEDEKRVHHQIFPKKAG